MTRMTRPDCAVMCNLIHTHTHTHSSNSSMNGSILLKSRSNAFGATEAQKTNSDFHENRTHDFRTRRGVRGYLLDIDHSGDEDRHIHIQHLHI